jgi:hypothetical protein
MDTPKPASEADLRALAVELFLAIHRVQNQLTAIGRALKDRGILQKDEYLAALRQAEEDSREARENLRKINSVDPMIELLREFQGPIQ